MQGLGNLLGGMLERHGITKQVTSTMIVQRANAILADIARPPLVFDICATVYQHGELIVACKHTAASYDLQALLPDLRDQLARTFPNIALSAIRTRISPAEWYNRDAL